MGSNLLIRCPPNTTPVNSGELHRCPQSPIN
jgi:hypothetical protein